MKKKNLFTRILRKPAVIFVTWYALYIYRKGVMAAERRHENEGNIIYLAEDTFRPNRLTTFDKAEFKSQKRFFGTPARLLTMNTLKNRCYYHTADRFGKNGLSKHDATIRKKAFVKERLSLAGLI